MTDQEIQTIGFCNFCPVPRYSKECDVCVLNPDLDELLKKQEACRCCDGECDCK